MPVRLGPDPIPGRSAFVPDGYNLVFNDEFDGPLSIEDGDVATTGATWADKFVEFGVRHLAGNNDQCLKASNGYRGSGGSSFEELGLHCHQQAGSTVLINAFEIPTANRPQFFNFPHAGGMLSSERTFRQEYGYWEIRAAVPAVTAGHHWSLWLYSGTGTAARELDFIEIIGSNSFFPNGPVPIQFFNSHEPVAGSTHGSTFPITQRNVSHQDLLAWHTYGIEVTPSEINWFIDGVQVRTVPQYNLPGSVNWYILATPETGASPSGNFPGPANASTVWPATMAIDYVRAYGPPA